MQKRTFSFISPLFLSIVVLFLTGCMATGKYSQPAPESNMQIKEDKAAIVFMRASSFGGAITSPLLQVEDESELSLVGIIGPNEKMVHYVEPGSYRFMVMGENADFMNAEVEAGKAYYAIIRPRMGVWKARFSLTPFKLSPEKADFNLNGANLKEWSQDCEYVVSSPEAQQWFTSKKGEVKALHNEYHPAWMNKSDLQQGYLTLKPEDGFDQLLN